MLSTRTLSILALSISLIILGAETLKPKVETSEKDKQCLERVGELERCLPKLVVYGDRKFEPPRSEGDLDKHCRSLDDNLKCVSSYSRECLPSFARNLYSVLTRRLKTQFSKRCNTKDGRRDFLNLMACADAKHMEPGHKCMDAFIANIEHIGNGNQNRQIELTCCSFQLFQDCIFTASKKMQCSQRVVTAEKSIEYVKTLINTMGGDMMEIMCGKYDKVSACDAGHAKMMGEFRNITARVQAGTLKPQSGSALKPMLQLFIETQEQ